MYGTLSTNGLATVGCVRWLCDPSNWTQYTIPQVSNYAIGSPSVEMYIRSYNVWQSGSPESYPIEVGWKKEGTVTCTAFAGTTVNTKSGAIGPNRVLSGPGDVFGTTKTTSFWLSSPGYSDGYGDRSIWMYRDSTNNIFCGYDVYSYAFMPLILLNK